MSYSGGFLFANLILRKNIRLEFVRVFILSLPYRYVYAIATEDSVFFYDTQSLAPFSYISGIHYSNLSDLSWSADGKYLVVTSIDGFCTFVFFKPNELGTAYGGGIDETQAAISKLGNNNNNKETTMEVSPTNTPRSTPTAVALAPSEITII
jgi:WD40 repeat protein